MYTAYVLDDESRALLEAKFPPKYERFVGHHVTHEFGVPEGHEVPVGESVRVIGHKDSDDGIEALVVSIDGNKERPDGKLYHITWSFDPGKYAPKDSNELLRVGNYTLKMPIEINATPSLLG